MVAALTQAQQRDRILSRIHVSNGCWLWQGRVKPDGYGTYSGKQAHRYSYAAFRGAIPPGMELDHLCRVTSCVNPDHLEPVTHAENKRRRYVIQTHCKRGHEFTPENTYMGAGVRRCRKCQAVHCATYKQRRRSA